LAPLNQSKNCHFNIPHSILETIKIEISSLESITKLELRDWIEKTDTFYGGLGSADKTIGD